MNDTDLHRVASFVMARSLDGASETELLNGFCTQCRAVGVDLSRAMLLVDTLHPVYEGRAFRWRNDGVEESAVIEYRPTSAGAAAESWQRSPFYQLFTTGTSQLRHRLTPGAPLEFQSLETLRTEGETDYVAFAQPFASEGRIGELDCVYAQYTTRAATGFADGDLTFLKKLLATLALAIKCASLARIAGTLVEVYLGRDAGQRVLAGRIARGVADRINAVLWFSDLRGYTSITDSAPPDEIIPLLNDYAEAVISAIHEHGGEVLKLIGDGTLAIFRADEADDVPAACRRALAAEADLRRRVAEVNARRTAEQRPVTSLYLGLHIGDVFYGNIGSDDRLDFTVVGPAVNEVSRIASMCRSVDRAVVLSADFAAAAPPPERGTLVSVGRFALRGVGRAQELFTLDPALVQRRVS